MAVVDPGVDHGPLRAALFEILINFFERTNKFFSPFIFFFPNSRFCYVNRIQNYSIISADFSRVSVGFSSNQWRAQTISVAWTANLLSWNAKSDASRTPFCLKLLHETKRKENALSDGATNGKVIRIRSKVARPIYIIYGMN